jgi:hypothetical protein
LSLTKPDYGFNKEEFAGSSIIQVRNKIVEAVKEQSESDSAWVNVKDPAMASTIMNIYGDALSRKLLNSSIGEPHTIMEILNITKVSHTTGYRRLLSLIQDNFLLAHHMVQRSGGKQVTSYMATFKEIEFHMSKNQELVRVKFQQ